MPEEKGEDLFGKMLHLAAILDVPLEDHHVSTIHRLPSRRELHGQPRAILVKMSVRWKKEQLLAARRKKKSLKTSEMGYQGPDSMIYFGEHLTREGNSLYKKCRELRQEGRVYDVWTSDCKIFMRIEEKSHQILISSNKKLDEVIQGLPVGVANIVKECRKLKEDKKIADTWTKNGRVMVRKTNGEGFITIQSDNDLAQLKSTL